MQTNKETIARVILKNDNTYYVYGLLRPNEVPFYIGKGKEGRIFEHELEIGSSIKHRIIQKIKNQGEAIKYKIFRFCKTEKQAYSLEMKLIKKYGKITTGGILANITDGGDGWRGGTHSEKTKSLISKKQLKRMSAPEYRKQRSLISKKLCSNPKHRIKIKQGVLAYNLNNPDEREKQKQKQKMVMRSDQIRSKMSVRMKLYYEENPDAKEKNSKAVKKYYKETPGAIEKNRKAVKKAMSNPEVKKKMSESAKKRYKKMEPGEWSRIQKEKLSSIETRKKMSESAKKRRIVRKCKVCHRKYFKKALNQYNKDICDTCKAKA